MEKLSIVIKKIIFENISFHRKFPKYCSKKKCLFAVLEHFHENIGEVVEKLYKYT